MIRDDELGFWYMLELKCQVCGLVIDHTEIFGETAIEAAHDASEIRNQVRCSVHENQDELTQFTPDDFDSMFLSDEECDDDE